jgi:hypothetical protein
LERLNQYMPGFVPPTPPPHDKDDANDYKWRQQQRWGTSQTAGQDKAHTAVAQAEPRKVGGRGKLPTLKDRRARWDGVTVCFGGGLMVFFSRQGFSPSFILHYKIVLYHHTILPL